MLLNVEKIELIKNKKYIEIQEILKIIERE